MRVHGREREARDALHTPPDPRKTLGEAQACCEKYKKAGESELEEPQFTSVYRYFYHF